MVFSLLRILSFIYRVSENCIKMIFRENRSFQIRFEDTESIIQVINVQESTAKFQNHKSPFSKPVRISVPQIRGWTVGCFRREPRINTDRFPKRAPKTQIARWDPGACSPGSTFVPWCLFHGNCDGENFLIFFKSFFFKSFPVCFWFQIWLSSAYLHQSYTRSPRPARFWILLP